MNFFLAFIDIEKTYDSEPHSNLWKFMANMGINGTILNILKEYYTDNVAYVKIGNELSDPIEVTKGLRQGCGLSPILFNIYLEKTLDHWKKSCKGMGVPIKENKFLFSLNYADDQSYSNPRCRGFRIYFKKTEQGI